MNTTYNNSRSKKLPKHQLGVPVPAAQQQVQDATVGAPLSNTAPSNCIEGNSESLILRTGVDSLYLSYAGSLKLEVEEKLESLKTLAQSTDQNEKSGLFIVSATIALKLKTGVKVDTHSFLKTAFFIFSSHVPRINPCLWHMCK